MKRLIPILCVTLSLTACSGPDSSGGVALSKDPYPTNAEFPHGDCDDDPTFAETNTGCGWIHINERSYYIKPGADLTDADLTGASLIDADLTGAYLTGANLRDVTLYLADLNYADLSGADLTHANLSYSDLTDAYLIDANLTGANLNRANLNRANLIGADLRYAYLRGANLSDIKANELTTCPNKVKWGTAGNDCRF